jgi:hypothetical protein
MTVCRRTRGGGVSGDGRAALRCALVPLLFVLGACAGSPVAPSTPRCIPALWTHVYNSGRLRIFDACRTVTGIVATQHASEDGDIVMQLALDPPFVGLLNSGNVASLDGHLQIGGDLPGTLAAAGCDPSLPRVRCSAAPACHRHSRPGDGQLRARPQSRLDGDPPNQRHPRAMTPSTNACWRCQWTVSSRWFNVKRGLQQNLWVGLSAILLRAIRPSRREASRSRRGSTRTTPLRARRGRRR